MFISLGCHGVVAQVRFPAMTLRSTLPFILPRSINEYQHAGVSGPNCPGKGVAPFPTFPFPSGSSK